MLRLSFAALVACGQAPDEMAIPLDRAGAMFELAERLSATDGGELWGADLYGPMLFVDSKSRAIVANQADGEGLLRQSGKLWVGTMPEEIQLANTSLDWAGVRWTMVLWGALPSSIYERGKLMMHECFHRLQPQLEFEFDPNQAESLDAKRIVYTPLKASDIWGTLNAPDGGMIDFGSPMSITVPVPDGATIDSVGWQLNLAKGFRLDTPKEGNWHIVRDK